MKDHSIVIKQGRGKYVILEQDDILYIKASRSYCEIIDKEGRKIITLSSPLAKIERLEELSSFKRIHKSYLVNAKHIAAYQKGKKASVTLKNGTLLPVGKSKKPIFAESSWV